MLNHEPAAGFQKAAGLKKKMRNVIVKCCVGRITKKMPTMGKKNTFRARVTCGSDLSKCDNATVPLCSKKSCHGNTYKVTDIRLLARLPSMGLDLHREDAQFFFYFLLRKGTFLEAINTVLAQFPWTAVVVPQRIGMLMVSDWQEKKSASVWSV